MAFEWKDRFSLGIDEIDKQHKKLFEIGARVYELAILNNSYDHYDEILEVLNELLDYTEYHFKFEENLMAKHNYSSFEQQKHDHEYYVDKIRSIAKKDIDNDQQKTITEIVDFLSEWISSHILFSDRGYADYFNKSGIIV